MTGNNLLLPFLVSQNKGIINKGLTSPLAEEVKDGDLTIPLSYIPFLEGGDATLRVLRQLSELSPTKAGVILSKVGYTVGGGIDLIKMPDVLVKKQSGREVVISDAEHDNYVDFLTGVLDMSDVLGDIKKSANSLEVYGNDILELILTKVGRVRGGTIRKVETEYFRYKKGLSTDKKVGLVSQRWTLPYINGNAPVEYPMYPDFKEFPDGTLRCLIHNITPTLNRNWYGAPADFASIYWQYMEYQSGKFNTRSYENQFLPSIIIEQYGLPSPTDAQAAEQLMNQMYKGLGNVFTNAQDGIKYPVMIMKGGLSADGKGIPSSITQLSPKTGDGFAAEMKDVAQSQILKANQWHSSLIEKTASTIGNDSSFGQIAANTDLTVIRPFQEKVLKPYRTAIKAIESWIGYNNQSNITIGLKSVFEQAGAPINTPSNPLI